MSRLLTLSLGLGSLALLGCNDYELHDIKGVVEPLTLEVTSPTYGQFMGEEQILVMGRVSPVSAQLEIEGEPVAVGAEGVFTVALPVDHAYRIIEIEARTDKQTAEERIPVFKGQDPRLTFPNALTARVMPEGLAKLGDKIGELVDGLGLFDTILTSLPTYESDWITLVPDRVEVDPTVVTLQPAIGALDASFSINNLAIVYAVNLLGYEDEISVGFASITLDALLVPDLSDDGMLTIELTEASLDLSEPDVELGPLPGWVIDWVLGFVADWIIDPLAGLLLDTLLADLGVIELGGPIAIETDLLGTALAVNLTDFYSDLDGLGLGLDLIIGDPASAVVSAIPAPTLATPYAAEGDIAVGLHEGLFQILVGDALLGFLDQGLGDYGAFIGPFLDGALRQLPGGSEAPAGTDWCLGLEANNLYAARIQEGGPEGPLAVVYLPDFVLDIGKGGSCESWLTVSLAMELGLGLNGTELDLSAAVPEGKVLYYGASSYNEETDEAAVVTAMGSLMSTVLGLVGGLIPLDLSSLLGGLSSDPTNPISGLLADLAPAVVGTAPLENADGTWTEGLYSLSMDLWAD